MARGALAAGLVLMIMGLFAPTKAAKCQEGKGWQERVVYFRVKGHQKPFACHLKEVAPLMEQVYRRLYGEVEAITGYTGPLEAPPTLKGKRRAALLMEVEEIVRRMGELNRAFLEGRLSHEAYSIEYGRLWGLYWGKLWQLWVVN